MSQGQGEQIERFFDDPKNRKSRKSAKQKKHRRERRRVKQDPDCVDEYRKYSGWEY